MLAPGQMIRSTEHNNATNGADDRGRDEVREQVELAHSGLALLRRVHLPARAAEMERGTPLSKAQAFMR